MVIAGKTGTAQNWRLDADGTKQDDNHGWFIGFAPFEHPQLAFAIVKLGAKSGGGDCGPIAKRIVEEALALPADGSGEVKPVEEKGATAQTKFDFDGVEISLQVTRLAKESGVVVIGWKRSNGRLTFLGEGPSAGLVLNFCPSCRSWTRSIRSHGKSSANNSARSERAV